MLFQPQFDEIKFSINERHNQNLLGKEFLIASVTFEYAIHYDLPKIYNLDKIFDVLIDRIE